ncbi:hypothetical protein Cri9333_2955 [Crinalium epipsammum PCC 9333]|uniref:Uncharacterized protein n=1 Tax=Crinalium epipsammum PCC 9333 TaxID=1173022 RepID=K9W1W8_9CYAN|nr:hypothetical protein [Crinalium epipsammum]AFZ13794.1 hypothetical protein Cri9333_2955 [Crinalium epipsammum PCC 9333]
MKQSYEVKISAEAWNSIQGLANNFNLSINELFERVGSGQMAIVDSEDLEDYLDLQEAIEAEANPENQERLSWEEVKQELGL